MTPSQAAVRMGSVFVLISSLLRGCPSERISSNSCTRQKEELAELMGNLQAMSGHKKRGEALI
jgi:hypothetical protein